MAVSISRWKFHDLCWTAVLGHRLQCVCTRLDQLLVSVVPCSHVLLCISLLLLGNRGCRSLQFSLIFADDVRLCYRFYHPHPCIASSHARYQVTLAKISQPRPFILVSCAPPHEMAQWEVNWCMRVLGASLWFLFSGILHWLLSYCPANWLVVQIVWGQTSLSKCEHCNTWLRTIECAWYAYPRLVYAQSSPLLLLTMWLIVIWKTGNSACTFTCIPSTDWLQMHIAQGQARTLK